MSKRSIPNVDWANQLESVIRAFCDVAILGSTSPNFFA